MQKRSKLAFYGYTFVCGTFYPKLLFHFSLFFLIDVVPDLLFVTKPKCVVISINKNESLDHLMSATVAMCEIGTRQTRIESVSRPPPAVYEARKIFSVRLLNSI